MSNQKRGFLKKFLNFCQNPLVKKVFWVSFLLIIFLAILIFLYNFAYQGKIFPRTFVGGQNLGGKTKEQALEIIKDKSENASNNQIELKHLDQSWTLKTESIDLSYNAEKSAEIAWGVGRTGNFGKILKEQLKSIFLGNRSLALFDYDKAKLNNIISGIADRLDVPEKDASVLVDEDLKLKVTPEQAGQKLDFIKTKDLVLKTFGNFKLDSKADVSVSKLEPKVNQEDADQAKMEAEKLLKNKITIKGEKKDYTLEAKEIASWLVFVAVPEGRPESKKLSEEEVKEIGKKIEKKTNWTLIVTLNSGKIADYISNIAQEIYQEPKDAKFEVQDGKVQAFQLSQTGYEVDKEKSQAAIGNAIFQFQKEVDLPIKVTQPEVTSNSADKLGIKELVGEGTTNFSGSPQNRRHNIAVGANAFHGVLLKPGEEFSMLKYLGPVEASTGYLPELVIKEDRTIPEYGGGLCQVSTTMFRTTLDAGFKITERQNHSYRVRYYEPPVGMDATIYIPKPDFKFINDLESHVLIQTEVGENDLTFRFYGTKDGRRSETTDPYVYDIIGSGDPIYTESPDLAPGEIKRLETAHPGSKATFTYRVYDSFDKLINEQKFDSSYVPWPARYLYGPGTQIPPPE